MKKLNLKSLFTVLTVLFSISFVNAQAEWPCTVIYVEGGGYTDKVWAFSVPGTTNGWDNGYEGHKFLSKTTPAPQIYVKGSEGNYQISSNETIHNTSICFIPGTCGKYELSFEHYNLSPTYKELYLIDHIADSTINIYDANCRYSFKSCVCDISERFTIVSTLDETNEESKEENTETETEDKTVTSIKNHVNCNSKYDDSNKLKTVKVFSYESNIVFDNKNMQNNQVRIIDAQTGKIIKETVIEANGSTTVATNTKKGVYIVSIKTENGIENTTVMLK